MTRFWHRVRRALARGPERFLSVELVGACNLRCAYCFRDEEMLYESARSLSPERLGAILDATARAWPRFAVAFTGGEPSLHKRFPEVLQQLALRGLAYRLVTNGWHFDRILEPLTETRSLLQYVVFSIDGATRADHDRHRGAGSFERLMRALAASQARGLPFQLNVVLRRDSFPQMEALSLLGARLGARAVNFGALLPTSEHACRELMLSEAEERLARAEAEALTRVLRIPVRIALGLYDHSPGAHCYPLKGLSANVDSHGRLTLCGNLSSFRGGEGARDVLGEPLGRPAFTSLRALARGQLAARDEALAACRTQGSPPAATLRSPCLSCLASFDKLSPAVASALAAAASAESRAS